MSSEKNSLDALRINRSSPPRPRNAWLPPVLIILLLAAAGIAWWVLRPKPLQVQVVTALEQTSISAAKPTTLLNASGYVTARRASTVSSKVTGKVTEVFIEEGMEVAKDQVLAELDNTNVSASLRLAEAQLNAARKAIEEIKPNLAFAEKERKRYLELVSTKAASQSDLNRAETEVASLQARLEKLDADISVAEREVDSWRQQVEDTIIRAPFAGIVTEKNAQPGEMISPMSAGGGFTRTGICTIVDMSSLEIEVDVNESYINRVQSDQPVEAVLDSYSDWKIPARVIAIIPTADRQKATVKVRVAFENPDPRILPDMGVKVAFQSQPEKQPKQTEGPRLVIIPRAALRSAEGRDVVWVVNEGRAERRDVQVSQTNGDKSYIASGISSGESIIVDAPAEIRQGSRVTDKKSS